ncbi:MAG: hypothetical protein A2V70_05430 [Planctomycetes bacterium RBG_13_63_9]|nr:MAG: hypothetical protein A2V70_05430 [Planctomycetes bacterium RBG_13_63_9]
MGRLDLDPTRRLHQDLIARWQQNPDQFDSVCSQANASLSGRRVKFESTRNMPVALSALLLDEQDEQTLRHVAETLHTIVERALNWVLASADRTRRYFADHLRMFPYLAKTPGLETWQGVSRYDAVVGPDGHLKIIELNTGCPAGFLHSENFSRVTADAFASLGLDRAYALHRFGTIPPDALVDELLAIEAKANLRGADGLVALVNDENRLLNELDLMADAFGKRGRTTAIVDAAELVLRDLGAEGDAVYHQDKRVTLTFNKVRVSTENSPGWNWKPGFEDRYAAFLAGVRRGLMASVNNFCGLTIAEDKGLLGVLRLPEFQAELPRQQRDFIAEHVLWTTRLEETTATWQGKSIDLLPYLRQHPDQFVIKPANEGRGFRVVLGKHCAASQWGTAQQWDAACRPDKDLPCVAQEHAEACTLPVVMRRGDQTEIVNAYLTIGMAVIRGRYHGLLARVSADPVTNVGREGRLQAVFITRPGTS